MYFNAGGSDDADITGDLGNIMDFAETFSKMLCQAGPLEDGIVRVVLPDLGAAAMVKQKWEANSDAGELPENMQIDYLPPMSSSSSNDGSSKYVELMDAEMLVVLAPKQTECACILRLIDGMAKVGKDIPLVLLNPSLGTDSSGIVMKQAKALLAQATHTYHMAQYEPISDDASMAAGVVSRVWPRPFSTWEDNPEDPDSSDGYFLMDVSDKAPDFETVFSMLEASRDLRQSMNSKMKQMAKPRVRQ